MADILQKTYTEGYAGAPTTGASISTPEYPLSDLLSDGALAGEALDGASPCYIKNSDGLVYMSQANAAGNTEADNVDGFAFRNFGIGQPVTLVVSRLSWGDWISAPVGKSVFLSVTKGKLANGRAFIGQLACGKGFNDGKQLSLWPQTQPTSL